LFAPVAATILVAAGLSLGGSGSAAAEDLPARYEPTDADFYINYVEPKVDLPTNVAESLEGAQALYNDSYSALDGKYTEGNPVAARELAAMEAESLRTGKNPHALRYKQADETQVAQLLTILVEFNPNANDDFTDVMVPQATFDDATTPENERDCVLGNVQNGPLHNNLPDPASLPHPDNNSMWVPDFSPEFYNDMLYTEDGITERVRTDLTGPDGQPGIDLTGYSMRNMYYEMSKGAYTVDGAATPWVEVPHSEAWYGANVCSPDGEGGFDAGPSQGMQGHPDNPTGAQALAIDAVDTLAAQDPDFPWADYDVEDVSDADDDGNYLEPDGVIDHLVLVHAGADKSGGGGAQGPYAIWAHSSSVPGGYTVPGTDVAVSNYIVQPEDSGVGVFAHEYGHDLGLPDLYDTSNQADSDVDFWDLMASGSHSGPIFQGIPTHMGLWDKWVLGWADPLTIEPGDDSQAVRVGQTSRTPVNTEDGIRVLLPNKTVTLAEPHSGESMWYSSNDQSWADVRLGREFNVPAGSDVRFWTWNNYVIEDDWDFGFIEVSTDGGANFEEQKVYYEDGTLASTDDDYPDPNGRMADYGGKKYGIHGNTGGAWEHYYVDLTPFAGQTIQLRLRYATDAAFEPGGWFVDDIELTDDGDVVFSDDAETNTGWDPVVDTFTTTSGAGWILDSGTSVSSQYYLVEWRNYDGFDEGLRYAYDTTYLREEAWQVERLRYNAPGALVWYRDVSYGNSNHVAVNAFDPPSLGSKGGLLIVDSHYEPMRRTGAAADVDPSSLKNLPSRPQSSNAAFSTHSTYAFTECLEAPGEPFSSYCSDFGPQPGVTAFTDAKTWYPGVEFRPDLGGYFFRDNDASVVIPSVDNQPYTVRIVDANGDLLEDQFGLNLAGFETGTGNPADSGVEYGVEFKLLSEGPGKRWAVIWVNPA
jgi:immune inhibitor A